ncbi:hypothetical protein JHK87_013852 [Glycine soja]|nr:hypothetical protein JHK87_013852 [Glycine soja]
MGIYAKSALKGFIEMVRNRRGGSVLGLALGSELRVVRLEREIGEFVKKGRSGEEKFGVRLKKLEQQCEGSGLGSLMSCIPEKFTYKVLIVLVLLTACVG